MNLYKITEKKILTNFNILKDFYLYYSGDWLESNDFNLIAFTIIYDFLDTSQIAIFF